jgi:putative DNA primase/helicase
MDYYSLDVPQSCQDALEEYKTFVDPIRMFLSEIMPKVKWDLLPFTFLYDLYVAWYKATEGSDRNIKSRPTFIKEVRQIVMTTYPKWDVVPDKTPMRIGNRMADAEPLIMDFHLDNWFNPRYKASGDVNLACHPVLSSHYRGIFRRDRQNGSDEDVAAVVTVGDDDDDEVINVDT